MDQIKINDGFFCMLPVIFIVSLYEKAKRWYKDKINPSLLFDVCWYSKKTFSIFISLILQFWRSRFERAFRNARNGFLDFVIFLHSLYDW